jgi:annexin-like protein
MGAQDIVQFSAERQQAVQGWLDRRTGDAELRGTETNRWVLRGNLSAAEREHILAKVSSGAGDPSALRERIAQKADGSALKKEPAREYTELGRYAEAPKDGAIGEGMKGGRVSEHQELLKHLGYDLGQRGVDSYWGKDTEKANGQWIAEGRPKTREERERFAKERDQKRQLEMEAGKREIARVGEKQLTDARAGATQTTARGGKLTRSDGADESEGNPLERKLDASASAGQAAAAMGGRFDGTDSPKLIDALTGKSPREIREIKDAFKTHPSNVTGEDLETAVRRETSGDYRETLVNLLNGNTSNRKGGLRELASADAEAARKAFDVKSWLVFGGTDNVALQSMLTSRSPEEIRALSKVYQEKYGESFRARVEDETSGNFRKTLLAIIDKAHASGS